MLVPPPFAFALTISMVLQVTITNQHEQTFIHDSRLTPAELRQKLVILNEVNTSGERNKLRTQLKETERTQHRFLFLLREMYDPAGHLTNKEYMAINNT